MEITVLKVTDEKLMRRAIEMTMLKEFTSKMDLSEIYSCEHSPIYTQWFWIEMKDIYSFVSTHFVRHHVGVSHYVSSRRDDRGGSKDDGRYSLVNHGMMINAKSLIDMSRKRLCLQAHTDTVRVMMEIRQRMMDVDYALAERLMPECYYRGGICHELKSCGLYKEYVKE